MNERSSHSHAFRLAAVGLTAGILAFVAALAPTASFAQDTRPVRPSPEQCQKQCDERARAVYAKCVADNPGAEERCANMARDAAQKCKEACGKQAPPPSAISACARDCGAKARDAHKACLEVGGDPAACAEEARALLRACTAACPKPEPSPNLNCDRLCALAAAHAEKRCLDAGGSAERCSAVAADTLAKCARRCANGEKPAPGRPTPPSTGPRPRN